MRRSAALITACALLFSWLEVASADPMGERLMMASVRNRDGRHICTGAPFKNVILTLASCLESHEVQTPTVEIKVFDTFWKNEGAVKSHGVSIHPQYSGVPGSEFDIAAVLADGDIHQISYGYASNCPVASQSCDGYLASWESPGAAQMRSLTRKSCTALLPGEFTNQMICGITKDSYACGHTPGAPLIVNGGLLGVALKYSDCGRANTPLTFASIPVLQEWIDGVSKDTIQESSAMKISTVETRTPGKSWEGPPQPTPQVAVQPPPPTPTPAPPQPAPQVPPPQPPPQVPPPPPPTTSPSKDTPASYPVPDSPAAITSSIRGAVVAGNVDQIASILTQSTDIAALASGFSMTGK